jgi:hypothetical protein
MANVRIHRYSVEPADVDELIARRAALIDVVRADHPGLAETRLIRLDDGTFVDIWRWESTEAMDGAIAAAIGALPDARAAWSLTRDASSEDGEIVDAR